MQWTYTYHTKVDISSVNSTKFWGLLIDNNVSWHCHVDEMITKQSILLNQIFETAVVFESLKMVYFLTVHSIISYGIIFWGISTHCKIIFKIQKRIIMIIMKSGNKDSCRDLFKKIVYSTSSVSIHIFSTYVCC